MRISLFVLVALVTLSLAACKSDDGIEYPYEHENGTVTAVEVSGDTTIIYVDVMGYAPVPIKTAITFDASGTVITFIVTEHMETVVPGGTVIDGDFRDLLIANQDNLGAVDLIAGATLTAEALVHAIETAMAHYDLINE